MKQPLLSSVWSVMLDGKSSSCKIIALEGSKPTGAIIFEFIKLYSYGINNIFAFNEESLDMLQQAYSQDSLIKWQLKKKQESFMK